MSILDKDLVRSINSGRAFMLVGSGPSCAAGLPSWKGLAKAAVEFAVGTGATHRRSELEGLIESGPLPEVFERCAEIAGGARLAEYLSTTLDTGDVGRVYPILAAWPIATYLTTNFDDLMSRALHEQKEVFLTRGNSQEDMRELTSDTAATVFKLHGDLTDWANVVLTSSQYRGFSEGEERKYWRMILFSVLRMCSVVIVGYSASDPNFQIALKWAREYGAPNHPIYMFTSGLSTQQVDELYEKHNVRALLYENPDGDHQELVRLLKRYDPFIARRRTSLLGLPPVDEDQARLAGALFVFTRARLVDDSDSCLERTYCALVLTILGRLGCDSWAKLTEVARLTSEAAGSVIDPRVMERSVAHLYQMGYLAYDADASTVALLPRGEERVGTAVAERRSTEERFELACRLYLRGLPNPPSDAEQDSVIDAIKRGIVAAFERRGLEISRSVLTDTLVDVSDATDILSVVNDYGGSLDTLAQRSAFADLVISVLLEPGAEMKAYLASISQGYFAYHALGWDSAVADERLALARKTTWILDSSVVLYALADQCVSHRYAEDLLSRMSDLGIKYLVTERLFEEVEGHARWAIKEFANKGLESIELLKGAMVTPGHRQNLFIEGFVGWAEGRGAPTLSQYMEEVVGTARLQDLSACLLARLEQLGIEVRKFEDWPTVAGAAETYADRDELVARITAERQRRGTYKKESQCVAEAEVLMLARLEDVSFLTLSNALKGMSGLDHRVNWQPEALYRFLSLFSSRTQDAETLFESMTQTFYYCGFDLVDRAAVTRFAAGMAHQARIQIDEARGSYAAALEEKDFGALVEDFDGVPDEQKPFYAMQFAHLVASRAAVKAEAAERRVSSMQERAKMSDKDRAELERHRSRELRRKQKAKQVSRRNQSKPKKKKRGH